MRSRVETKCFAHLSEVLCRERHQSELGRLTASKQRPLAAYLFILRGRFGDRIKQYRKLVFSVTIFHFLLPIHNNADLIAICCQIHHAAKYQHQSQFFKDFATTLA